jgi:hypothetical protein
MPSSNLRLRGPGFLARHASHPRISHRQLVVKASGNTFGHSFRVTTFGESHGGGVGCVVDGVPPRLQISQVREVKHSEGGDMLDARPPGGRAPAVDGPAPPGQGMELLLSLLDIHFFSTATGGDPV